MPALFIILFPVLLRQLPRHFPEDAGEMAGRAEAELLRDLADVPAGAPELTEALYAELAEAVLSEKQYTAAEAAIQAKAAVSELVKNTELINELDSKADDVDISFDDMPEAEDEVTPDAAEGGN